MKKVLKRVLNGLTLVAMVLVMALSVIAFSTISGNAANDSTNTGGDTNVSTGPVTPENPTTPSEPTNPDQTTALPSGIYQFNKELGFEDIYYTDLEELITYFETKDLNGVYNAVQPSGFDEFVKNIALYNDNYRAMYFNDGIVKPMYNNNGTFTFIETTPDEGELTFQLENGKIVTNMQTIKLEYDSESNIVTFIVNFNYTYELDGETKIVITPLYIKASLTYIEDSASAFEGTSYTYIPASATIVTTTSNSTANINDKLNTLVELLGIEVAEGENAADVIEQAFNGCSLIVNENATRIVVDHKNGSYTISSINAEDNTFSWNNTKVKITERSLNLNTNEYVVVMEIAINDNTNFVFKFSSII